MHPDIAAYNDRHDPAQRAVCHLLADAIAAELPDAQGKIWHAHPVWFLQDNPIVGYSREKAGIRLMFWSGAGFDEPGLPVLGAKFKDASAFLNDVADVDAAALQRWLGKARRIQWDYANLAKRKGRLERLPTPGAGDA